MCVCIVTVSRAGRRPYGINHHIRFVFVGLSCLNVRHVLFSSLLRSEQKGRITLLLSGVVLGVRGEGLTEPPLVGMDGWWHTTLDDGVCCGGVTFHY